MTDITQLLGKDAESLLQHRCITIPSDQLYLPGADYVDRVMVDNNRPPAVLRNMQTLYNTGRTGEPATFPFCRLTVAWSTRRAPPLPPTRCTLIRKISSSWRSKPAVTAWRRPTACWPRCRAATRIASLSPVKLNHNETLSYPTEYDQTLYASVEQAFNMGAVAVGATIYFGSEQSRRQIEEISAAFERAHELGTVTVLWAYLRNSAFKKDGVDYHVSADLTGQANHGGHHRRRYR